MRQVTCVDQFIAPFGNEVKKLSTHTSTGFDIFNGTVITAENYLCSPAYSNLHNTEVHIYLQQEHDSLSFCLVFLCSVFRQSNFAQYIQS